MHNVGAVVLVYHGGSRFGQAFGFWHGIHLGIACAIVKIASGRKKT